MTLPQLRHAFFHILSLEPCPSSHPFAYSGGKYCCESNKEKNYKPHGSKCDGGILHIDSSCCRDDKHSKCQSQSGYCSNAGRIL